MKLWRRGLRPTVFLWCLHVIGFGPEAFADWPQFRGPTHDAISRDTQLLDDWPPAGPPVLWNRDLGTGYSSFAVVGDRAFTQYQASFGQYVVCLDASSGATIWEYRYDWPYEGGGLYPGPRATPTATADHVYFAAVSGKIGCLRAHDGQLVWSANLVSDHAGRGMEFGYSASPLLADDLLIVPVGGQNASVVALDALTGATRWTVGSDPASYSTPLPLDYAGRKLVVIAMQNSLLVLDRSTGAIAARVPLSQGYDEHATAPIFSSGKLCLTSAFRAGATQYEFIDEDHQIQLKTRWLSRELSNDVSSSVLSNGFIYGFDLRDIQAKLHRPSRGVFRCLDWETGRTLWTANQFGQSSIIVADKKLILFTDRGEVILVRESPAAPVELARTLVFGDEICWTSPALSQGRLYLRSPSRAVCLDLRAIGSSKNSPQVPRVDSIATGPRWDLQAIVGGEREAPFDPPTRQELSFWLVVSTGVMALAAVLTFAISIWTGFRRSVAIAIVFSLGILGGPLVNRVQPEFCLTWPLSLYAAFQGVIDNTFWAVQQPNRAMARWISRGWIAVFLTLCVSYLILCQRLGMVMEIVFLLGFAGAIPISVWSSWRSVRANPNLRLEQAEFWLYFLTGFACFYLTVALFIQIRLRA